MPTCSRREIVCWDVAAGTPAGSLLSEANSDWSGDQEQRTWSWLPRSTIFLSDHDADRLAVLTPQAQVLGTTAVQLYKQPDSYVEPGPERFTASASGQFLAGQSGTCLAVFTAPECALHMQLELGSSPMALRMVPPGVHVCDLCWSPDELWIICSTYGPTGYSLCSLAGKCWQHALYQHGVPECISAKAWTPRGVIGNFLVGVDDGLDDKVFSCVELAGLNKLQPVSVPDELSYAHSWTCSPDFRWVAAVRDETVHIVCSKTLSLAASVSCKSPASVSCLVWATSMSALLCMDMVFRPPHLVRFS